MQTTIGKRCVLAAKVAFSITVLAWLVHSLDVDALASAFRRIDASSWLLASTLFLAQAGVVALRWQRIVARLGGRLPFNRAFALVQAGLFFNQLLPTSIGGDVARVWALHRLGCAPGSAFNSVAIERASGVTALGIAILVCLPATWSVLPRPVNLALLAVGPALLTVLLLVAARGERIGSSLPIPARAAFVAFAAALRKVLLGWSASLELLVLGVAAQVLMILPAWVIGANLGVLVSAPAFIVVIGGTILLSTLPVSLGGWGVREAALVSLLGAFGVRPEHAVTIAVSWALLPALLSVPAGLLYWSMRHGAAADAPRHSG